MFNLFWSESIVVFILVFKFTPYIYVINHSPPKKKKKLLKYQSICKVSVFGILTL